MNEKKEYSYNYTSQNDEAEIDLIDAFFYLIKRWRSIMLFAVLGLALGLAFGYYKGVYKYAKYEPNAREEMALEQLNLKYEAYHNQIDLDKNNYLLKLNNDEKYCSGSVIYYIHANTMEKTQLLGTLLNFKNSNEYLDNLKDILNYAGENIELTDILSYEFAMNDSKQNVIYQNSLDEDKDYGTITCQVQYVTETQANLIFDYLNKLLLDKQSDAVSRVGSSSINLIVKNITPYIEDTSSIIVQAKSQLNEKHMQMLDEYYALINSIEKNSGKLYNNPEKLMEFYNVTYRSDENTYSPVKTVLKWGIIVCILVAFVWVGFIALMYLCSGVIHTDSEIISQHGIKVVGRLYEQPDRKNPIDKLIVALSGKDKAKDGCTADYIADSFNILPANKVCISNLTDINSSSELVDYLEKNCEKNVVSGMLHSDIKLLEESKAVGGVYVLVALGKSKVKDLKATIETCKLHSLDIFGAVIIDRE